MTETNADNKTLGTPKQPLPNARYIDHFYAKLLNRFGSIDLIMGGSLVIHTVTYWSVGLGLLLFEFGLPSIALGYKTQPNRTVTWKEIVKLLKLVIPNQILLALAYLAVRTLRPKQLQDKFDEQCSRTPPSYLRIMGDYLFNLGVFEVVFYLLHRTLHDLRWYKYVHKIHHQFKAPVGLAAEYAHIVELFLSNIVPGAIGPALSNAHPVSTWIWLAGSLVQTLFHHSGLMLPFYPLNQWTISHDWHHAAFTDQFGVVGIMDNALQTTGDQPYLNFSNEIWQRTGGGSATVAGSALVRVATVAALIVSRRKKMLVSSLFQSIVR